MSQTQRPNEYEPNTAPILPLSEWLTRDKEWAHNEYVRVIPDYDDMEIRLYRLLADAGSGEFVGARLPLRRLSTRETDRRDYDGEQRKPKVWHLHGNDAVSVITWLEYVNDREEVSLGLRWYGDNGKGLTEGNDLTEETLILQTPASNGTEEPTRMVQLDSVWATEQQMLASF